MASREEMAFEMACREFGTGAVRDGVEGKGRCDLLMADAVIAISMVLQDGAAHRAERNWEQGIPLHSFADSGTRHMFEWLAGKTDEGSYTIRGVSVPKSLCKVAWNALAAIQTVVWCGIGVLPEELIDIPGGSAAKAKRAEEYK